MFLNAPEISALFLKCIYDKIFELNKMPDILNISKIIPIQKTNGDIIDINDIRPISLLSVVAKLLEKLFLEEMKETIYKNNILNKNQTGFVKNKNTLNNIIKTHDKIFFGLKNKTNVVMISLDLTKAYDTIDRKYLIKIIDKINMNKEIDKYIKMFLSNRNQTVFYNNSYSDLEKSEYGLPQGSCLSPILFNLYLNVILEKFSKDIDIRAFADDLIIYFENKALIT